MATPADLARGWLQKGDSDRLNADRTTQTPGPYDTACFHAQQAVRPQFSLRHLMIVMAAQGLNFAVIPWPTCAIIGVVITLSLFVSFDRLMEWVAISSIAGTLIGLLTPPIVPQCGLRKIAAPAAPASATPIPAAAP